MSGRLAGLLLAAGQSRRFGPTSKLSADLAGQPVIARSAAALRRAGCAVQIAVTADPGLAEWLPGVQLVPPRPGPPAHGLSLAAGVEAAAEVGADAVLVTLADMPLVPAAHLRALAARAAETGRAATAAAGRSPMPPAVFPASDFPALMALTADAGARDLIADLEGRAVLEVPAAWLLDIDRPADLARAAELLAED